MGGVTFEILLILTLILLNGFLAMAEIAIVSARKVRLQQRAESGDDRAQMALDLANNPSDFLSTVQVGITLVGIVAGALGGAALQEPLGELLSNINFIQPYASQIAFVMVVLLITYLSLILGELAPKRLALSNPEGIAASLAGTMKVLARVAKPLVSLLSASTDGVLRLFGVKASMDPPVTEDEIKVLIEQGTQAGIFAEAEQDMVSAIFRLGDRRVGSLMTPRTEIIWLDLEDPVEIIQRKIVTHNHSRFPVAKGDLDHLRGVVLAKDLLTRSLAGEQFDIEASLQEPVFVPESMPALKVLDLFRESGQQQVLVIDEFGGLQGLVTLNDILEAIVGELPLPGELVEQEIIQREDGSWLLDGMLPVDEFNDLFGLPDLPNQERGYYQTVSGFVMDTLGRIPVTGDSFEYEGWRIEVMDMDGFRVDKVLMEPVGEPDET